MCLRHQLVHQYMNVLNTKSEKLTLRTDSATGLQKWSHSVSSLIFETFLLFLWCNTVNRLSSSWSSFSSIIDISGTPSPAQSHINISWVRESQSGRKLNKSWIQNLRRKFKTIIKQIWSTQKRVTSHSIDEEEFYMENLLFIRNASGVYQ